MSASSLRRWSWLVAVAIAPSVARAQGEPVPPAPSPAVGPPIQRITTASAVSTERLGSISGVRELPDGRVLVNDGTSRRLLLMDTTLHTVGVVLDSLAEVANTYGMRPGAIIPYRADTTLFVDPTSYAMLVIDPAGRIVRVRSVWRVQDVFSVMSPAGFSGWPGVDAKGRIVYRISAQPARPFTLSGSGTPYFPQEPDSAFVVAADLGTRKLDTLGVLRIPREATRMRRTVEGRYMADRVTNPLPATDDWAVLPDGSVAFVRARDYHVEYLAPDGTRTDSPRIPYEWQRMTDEDKQRLVDSVRTAQQRSSVTDYVSSMIRWVNQYRKSYPAGFTVPAEYRPPLGFGRDWKLPPGVTLPERYIYACAPGEEPKMGEAPAGGSGQVVMRMGTSGAPGGMPSCIPGPSGSGPPPPAPVLRQANVVPASELPDYRPPITSSGSVRADADGNLWIRSVPVRRIPGGTVYDVVSREGVLVSRLQLPPGYSLVGFGRGKVVYLSMFDASGIHLARVRLR